ncbi:GNAT family N-acetyltransferase, partial [Streptomyces durbertensis]
MEYVIRRVRADEWRELRDLRLAALADRVADVAFGETYAASVAYPEELWRQRASDGAEGESSATFVGHVEGGGELAGMMVVVREEGQASLFGVYVRPEHRGRGLAALLLDRATRWAWARPGTGRLALHVHERNERARAFYENRGFRPTGRTEAHRGAGGGTVLEMARWAAPSVVDGRDELVEEA